MAKTKKVVPLKTTKSVKAQFDEIKDLVINADPDILKVEANLNRAAGRRARKALQTFIKQAKELRKQITEATKKPE